MGFTEDSGLCYASVHSVARQCLSFPQNLSRHPVSKPTLKFESFKDFTNITHLAADRVSIQRLRMHLVTVKRQSVEENSGSYWISTCRF